MRRYDDPVDVRKGMVDGAEGPEQFLWRGRLWKVEAVVAHWVETGVWWDSAGARAAVLGTGPDEPGRESGGIALAAEPAEREVWRVAASRGRLSAESDGGGVFDLLFDWTEGSWRLARCLD
jgi:hypothetical protein